MLVIVGHGPSVLIKPMGSWLDSQTIVRLKGAPKGKSEFWGTRTDVLCANNPIWKQRVAGDYRFWCFPMKGDPEGDFIADSERWLALYRSYEPTFSKPSHGLMALFCAEEQGYAEVGVLGFDSFYGGPRHKWHASGNYAWPHDSDTEKQIIDDLNIEVINLGSIY